MVQVDVVDDGPGVPPDVMDRIFSPFFTTKPQGSGLGLAIVRKIVDAHDGRIDVSARPGGRHAFPRHAAGHRQPRAVSDSSASVGSTRVGADTRDHGERQTWAGFW